MKKTWVLLLAAAGLALLGCPSDVTPPEKLTEFDFVINGGNYQVQIPVDGDAGFVITEGEEYTVTFRIEGADSDFFPSHVGGKLLYKEEGDTEGKILSGWMFATPDPVAAPGTYRWTFKAGQANDDDKPIVSPATTPAGAVQWFTLNAQTSDYKQYPAHYEFQIKGSITVAKKVAPVGEETLSGEIALAFGADPSLDPELGKGNIEGDEYAKVAAASGNGAFLRFYITCDVTADAGKDGNAVGNVGNRADIGGVNPNIALAIPKGTAAQSNFSFPVDIEVELALEFVLEGQSHLFINMYDGKCTKVELWEYK